VVVAGDGVIGNGGSGWSVSRGEHGLDIHWKGKLVTTYRTDDGPKPYFYPVVGPTGETLTRGFPMDPQPDESKDHRHHRSLWFGHRDVNGIDFWSEPRPSPKPRDPDPGRGRIRHAGTRGIEVGPEGVTLRVENAWEDHQQRTVCEDRRTYRIARRSDGAVILDWDITISATAGDCTFGDNKDGTMAVRVIPGLRLKVGKERNQPGTGHILTSKGRKDEEAWGSRAKWVDYSGKDRSGHDVGVALFDHPENLRHPTWWHARNYGLCAANPFGVSYFEKKERGTGDFVLAAGESLRLRYRVLLHRGAGEAEALDREWRNWTVEES